MTILPRFLKISRNFSSESVYHVYGQDHINMQQALIKLIDKEINPYVDEWENSGTFPSHKIIKLLGNAGFLGVTKETSYGGLGLDFSYSMALAEAMGHINCGGIPMAIGAHSELPTSALSRFGSHELKEQFLTPTIKGDQLACLGVSEVGSGSDVSSIKTYAKTDGDDLIINGGKMWTTNGVHADWMCLLANTDASLPPHWNKSLICLPLKSSGVTVAKEIKKLGMWSSDTAQIFFDNVRVPRRFIIGEENNGFTYQMMQFQEERLVMSAGAVQPLRRCVQDTVEYCRSRRAFGKSILDNQVVHYRLAELETEIELLVALMHRCIAEYVHMNRDVTKLASMLKLKTGRLCREVTDSCLQFYGGMGFTQEMIISRFYRDLRLMSIGAGADEVMLAIICKFMKTLPAQ